MASGKAFSTELDEDNDNYDSSKVEILAQIMEEDLLLECEDDESDVYHNHNHKDSDFWIAVYRTNNKEKVLWT